MTQAELFQALKSIGMPVSYAFFSQPVEPPFICYQFGYNNDLMADNKNAIAVDNFQVELYTKTKDLPREKLVQDKLKELELPYNKSEAWIDEEKIYQVVYEIQLIGG